MSTLFKTPLPELPPFAITREANTRTIVIYVRDPQQQIALGSMTACPERWLREAVKGITPPVWTLQDGKYLSLKAGDWFVFWSDEGQGKYHIKIHPTVGFTSAFTYFKGILQELGDAIKLQETEE